MISINVNDNVWVKLTPAGEVLWAECWKRTSPEGVPKCIRKAQAEADGWIRFQLHELMFTFGEAMYNGNPELPFETEIRLTRGY
jgi:hypothetical protein